MIATQQCPHCRRIIPAQLQDNCPHCHKALKVKRAMTETEKNILQLAGAIAGGLILCGTTIGVMHLKYAADNGAFVQQQQQAEVEREQRIQKTTELLLEGKEATERAFPELKNP
jgi:hypothetical protein